jgi:hypothetical protein
MEKRGSDPSGLPIVPLGVLPDAAKHDAYESAGVTEAVFRLPSAPRDDVLPVLDDLSQYLRPVR